MIKVIIADDEKRIVNLIQFLVNWESLGMKVVDCAHNGLEALEKIKKVKPDIVITDIKMPGCDGLRMIEELKEVLPDINYIVISGYRQFEYAKQAIQYGVSNYILKPIDKEELNLSLKKVKKQWELREQEISSGALLEALEKSNVSQQRKLLLTGILYKDERMKSDITLMELNEKYSYHFEEGVFQTAVVKVDGIHEQTKEDKKYLEEKISHELNRQLAECFDWEYAEIEGAYYLILNYQAHQIDLKEVMKLVLEALLVQQHVLENFQVTIGIGIETQVEELFKKEFKAAKWAIDQRLVLGTDRVIQGKHKNANAFVNTNIFNDFNKEFGTAIELQDSHKMLACIDKLEERLLKRKNTTGYEIYQMVKEAVNVYMFMLRKLDLPTSAVEKIFEKFNEEINNCGLVHDTFTYLKDKIRISFELVIQEKGIMDSKPIRVAKTYIAEHLSEPISLEIVSDVVGFNMAYFSTIFKKETGSTFSEYLLEKRMERAKELLRETKEAVSTVCVMVGYSDVKHFTKNFIKYTSLKPNEYRKLYS